MSLSSLIDEELLSVFAAELNRKFERKLLYASTPVYSKIYAETGTLTNITAQDMGGNYKNLLLFSYVPKGTTDSSCTVFVNFTASGSIRGNITTDTTNDAGAWSLNIVENYMGFSYVRRVNTTTDAYLQNQQTYAAKSQFVYHPNDTISYLSFLRNGQNPVVLAGTTIEIYAAKEVE